MVSVFRGMYDERLLGIKFLVFDILRLPNMQADGYPCSKYLPNMSPFKSVVRTVALLTDFVET